MIPTSDWGIQLVTWPQADARNARPRYRPWAGYTQPVTGDQAMCVVRECEAHWLGCEFRAHTINGDGTRFI
ncbi:MAG TPA: hypothetical protein VKB76_05945, partial [Ktedonobacterales bacterium]|nr:hypothetical protein [Ktedonobacterales bacterium]